MTMLARDEDILKAAEDWRKAGRNVALATVTETWGSAPRPVGSNLVIEARFAEAKPERLPGLVKELIDAKVDVVMAFSYPAARAAKDATKLIPIVIDGASDPVGTGLVASLSRPGGNVTGLSDMAAELSAKRLSLLRELVPSAKKVALLFNSADLQ